jgi:hypothetical protein
MLAILIIYLLIGVVNAFHAVRAGLVGRAGPVAAFIAWIFLWPIKFWIKE